MELEKKLERKLEGKKGKRKTRKGEKSQYWIWAILATFVVAFFAFYFAFSGLDTFTHENLAFDIQKYQDLTIYHHSYFYTFEGQTYKNNVFLRIDPRKNDIGIDGIINYERGREVLIGINNTGIAECRDSSIAIGNVVQFFDNNLFEVEVGTLDVGVADERNQTYVKCSEHPSDTVIQILTGEESKIKLKGNCYTLSIASCEDLLPVTEKFIVQSLVDAKVRLGSPS